MSVNDKVTIRWLTEDGWKGSEQSFKRRCLKPESPEPLLAGQKVDVKFNRRWFPAEVVTPWSGKKSGSEQPKQTNHSKGKSEVLSYLFSLN